MTLPPPPGPWNPPTPPEAWQPPVVPEVSEVPEAWAPPAVPPQAQTWPPPPPVQPESSPAGRRSKRRLITWVSVAAAVVVLVGAAAVAASLINDARDPAAQVEEYLDLLAAGKAQQATGLVDPGVSDDSLLTDEVLGAADERIDVVSVETVDRSGESARVLARMSLAGEEFEREFTVDHGPNEWLVLETWELNEALVVEATITLAGPSGLDSGPAKAQVAGADITIADAMTGHDSRTVTVYPGVYAVTAGELGTYLTSGDETLTAGQPESLPEVMLTAELNGAFEEEVLAQAAAYADGCVLVGGNDVVSSNMDSSCPVITRNKRLSEMKVAKYPTALSDLGGTSFKTEEYEFEVRSSSADANLDRSTSSLSGEISWKAGKPSISDADFGWW